MELLLDAAADDVILAEWDRLAEAGLPSERRKTPSRSHRPHITLFAANALPQGADQVLPSAVAGLDLLLVIGSPMVFGPRRRGRGSAGPADYVLVRQVVPSLELLELQRRIALMCEAAEDGPFGPGRWSPHLTLARRASAEQIGRALAVLAAEEPADQSVRVTDCRRWDSDARQDWLLT